MSKQRKTAKPAARNRKAAPKAAPKAARNGHNGASRTATRIKVLPSKQTRGAPPPRISRAAFGKGPKPAGRPAAAKPASAKPARARVRICKQENCNNPQTTSGFCRLHYLQNWRALREEKAKRAQKNLDRYVERMAGAKKPAAEDTEESAEGGAQKEEQVFEEDFGEFVDVLSREENLDKILNGIKVEDY